MQNKDSMKKMLLLPKMIANFKVHSYIKRERKNCLFVTTVLYTEYCHQLWLNMLGGIFSVILYADWIIRTESAYSKVNTHLLEEPHWYICILSAFLYPFIVCVCASFHHQFIWIGSSKNHWAVVHGCDADTCSNRSFIGSLLLFWTQNWYLLSTGFHRY